MTHLASNSGDASGPRSARVLTIDLDAGTLTLDGGRASYALDAPEAFAAISRAWLRAGWDVKYVYSFTWLGRPIIQLPEDMIRLQELIFTLRPTLIIETGVAHGGSLVFYASLCKAMNSGRVVGVDVEIRPPNRQAVEEHPLAAWITLIEGSSTEPDTVERVHRLVREDDRVLVLLDSAHSKDHVLAELHAYAPLVTPGSYIVAMDGIMGDLEGAPRTAEDWAWNNPREAVLEFVNEHAAFAVEDPSPAFNEGQVDERVTYWPGGFVKRLG